MKANVRTSLTIASLFVFVAALSGWLWKNRNHVDTAGSSDSRSHVASTLGINAQKTAKVAPSSVGSDQEARAFDQESQPKESIPERLKFILNGDDTKHFAERVRSLRAIKRNLMIEEAEALYGYLRTPSKDKLNRSGENWLRNDIMDILVEQPALPQGYPDVLTAIYEDRAQDVVMRDYALQHFAPVYDRANTHEKAVLQNALWQGTGETDSSIAGTSLLALLELAKTDSAVDKNQIADKAFRLAADDRTGVLSRITAVQVCGRMDIGQALPVVKQLAQEAPSMPLRIAATAALGDYALQATPLEYADISSLLARGVVSSDPRQVLAAQSALRRIENVQATLAIQAKQQLMPQVIQ